MPQSGNRALRRAAAVAAGAALAATALVSAASGDAAPARPGAAITALPGATFTTVFSSPLGLEGLTGDGRGNLYVAARGGDPCPVWRVPVRGGAGSAVRVGDIPAPCGPSGIALDRAGRVYVADGGEILRFRPDAAAPPTAEVFATGVPGSNGIAFDARGALWVSDGTTGQGRVWRVGADGVPVEVFRVQPMVNDVNVVDGVGGTGRDPRSLPPGRVTITPNGRQAADTAGSQHLVANGLAFDRHGSLYVADTARGAVWKVRFGEDGRPAAPVGCDTTFPANTLCLDNVLVAHPYLEGLDGIALDVAGNIYGTANERNAVVAVTRGGRAVEVFRNPAGADGLRNGGPMEFPTSPFIDGRTLCVTHSDGSRRDNFPNTGGEVAPAGPAVAKISCLRQALPIAGLPLPV